MAVLGSRRAAGDDGTVERVWLRTAEGVSLRLDVAGAGSRLAAAVIDLFLLVAGLLTCLIVLQLAARFDVTGLSSFAFSFSLVGVLLIAVAYKVVFHRVLDGQTPGKMALQLRVVDREGHPASGLQCLLRGLAWPVDALLFVPVPIGLLAIALTRRRQRLGDLVAGTIVVRDQPGRFQLEPWQNERYSQLRAPRLELRPVLVVRFDAGDLAFLRELIIRRGIDAPSRERLLDRVATYYEGRLDREPTHEPRATLKELYLFLREHRAALAPARVSSPREASSG